MIVGSGFQNGVGLLLTIASDLGHLYSVVEDYSLKSLTIIRSSGGLTILVVLSLLISYSNVSAAINGYFGAGFFPTNNLRWCHVGVSYAAESQNAIARWSVDTDVNMTANCTGTHITTKYQAFGNSGWAGLGFVCSLTNCNNAAAWGANYVSCEARLNATAITANPAFYTNAEVQKLATHEIGHCYSLDHANVNGSVMNGGAVPNWQDINLVNARY